MIHPEAYLRRAIEAAKEVMAALEPVDVDWYVVGGAPRDVVLGNKIKDIDVFVSQPHSKKPKDFGSSALMRARRVFHKLKRTGETFEINVIYMRGAWTLEELADRCDVGICQIGIDPRTGREYRSYMFDMDLQNGTMTQTRETRSNHINKLIARWPDREYLNPMGYGLDEAWSFGYDDADKHTVCKDTFTFL